MERHHEITDRLDLIAGHMRLIADLMLAGPDLQDVDRGAFAQVLHDLAVRLEAATEELQNAGARHAMEQEAP
ncbi:MAG: hypothetical protein M0R77_09655 [Gammaproteobacteria bacterium]|nr:hypothetical protein [Gammaproteobacteria bacterium]